MPIDPGGNDADDSGAAALQLFENMLRDLELPAALAELSVRLGRMRDGEAAGLKQRGIVCSSAALSDLNRIFSGLAALANNVTNINNEITTISTGGGGNFKYGTGTVDFNGGADEHNTCTITADHALANVEWVNANSIWFGTVAMAVDSGPTYHFFQCSMGAFDPTPTAYFEIIVYCPTTVGAGTYDVRWVAFPNS
jgi:hypothetical protein